MKLKLPLLENGVGAISFFREELEQITRLRGTHPVLAPLLDTFLTEILFEEKTSLFDQRLICRLGDSDVREYVRATFVPIILEKTTATEDREPEGEVVRLSSWRPYQATHSPDRPALAAEKTLFNLVPCNRELEVGLTKFLGHAPDVGAFAKNAGPQALRIDYLTGAGRLALYTPDFLVRLSDGHHLVVETKGRVDRDVPLKARAAGAWCKSAGWEYVYVPEGVFKQATDIRMATLQMMCAPSLKDLIEETETRQLSLQFGEGGALMEDLGKFIPSGAYGELPPLFQRGIRQAVEVFQHFEKKQGFSFAPVFACLLGPIDEAAKGVLLSFLDDSVPPDSKAQQEFFSTDKETFFDSRAEFIKQRAMNLRRTLVNRGGLMPIGLLQWCLEYARQSKHEASGIFAAVKAKFAGVARTDLLEEVTRIYEFRNRYVAHQDEQLTDARTARAALGEWARGLHRIWKLHHK